MSVRFSLDQSIFTSGHAFGTVARSAGISADERRVLEQRAVYPRSWDGPPPLIFRSFPLPSEGDFAIARARFVEGDATGRLGNFVVHSYVARRSDVQAAHGNLAWLCAHLEWREANPAAPALPKADVHCDPSRALRLLRFVVPELSRDRAGQVLTYMLSHLGGLHPGQLDPVPLTVGFGPPSPEPRLRELLAAAHRADEEPLPVPGPHVLSLWRVAALGALLPAPFHATATFSINEVAPVADYALVVLRGLDKLPASVAVHPHVERCLTLIDGDRIDAVEALVSWLSDVMVTPSPATLADLSAFHNDVVVPLGRKDPLDWGRVTRPWGALPSHAPLRVEPLARVAKACLAIAPLEHHAAILFPLCRLAIASRATADQEIVDAILRVLVSEPAVSGRLVLQSQLPVIVQERVLTRAHDLCDVSTLGDTALWTLLALSARVHDEPVTGSLRSLPRWLFEELERRAWSAGQTPLGSIVEYLVRLGSAPIRLGDLRAPLVARAVRRLEEPASGSAPPGARSEATLPRRQREMRIVHDVLSATVGCPSWTASVEDAVDVVLDFVRACGDRAYGDGELLAHVLLAWGPAPLISRSEQSVRYVIRATGAKPLSRPGHAYLELLRLRRDPADAFQAYPLRDYLEWLERGTGAWRLPLGGHGPHMERLQETLLACFYRNVRQTVLEVSAPLGLALGLMYAERAPIPLAATLVGLLRNHESDITRAWHSGSVMYAGRRTTMPELLARLWICAGRSGAGLERDLAAMMTALAPYDTASGRDALSRALYDRGDSLKRVESEAGRRQPRGSWGMGGRR